MSKQAKAQAELKPFHNKDKIQVKPAFQERYEMLMGKENFANFMEYSLAFNRRGLRVNTLKTTVKEIKNRIGKDWELTPVPWSDIHFWIEHKGKGENHRRDVGNLPEHALGYIYIQDPASAIPPLVLDPKPGDTVLDMCAAPGSKTTQIAQLMKNKGPLVANEYTGSRIAALGLNMQRLGITNAIITRSDGNRLNKSIKFNKILVDGPCSGTGTIRKSPKTLMIWNPGMIKRLAKTQLNLLNSAYEHLESGGTMVYSTCTLEPEENEGVVSSFLEQHPDMHTAEIKLNINRSKPITEFEGEAYNSEVEKCLRIWPQDNDTEGFFVCKLVKD